MKENDIISLFFGSLPKVADTESDSEPNIECCLEFLKKASETFDVTFYVVDFKHRCFRFISNKGIFLGGSTQDDVQRLGAEFYPEVVCQKDRYLVAKIHQAVMKCFSKSDTICDLDYVVFDLRMDIYKGKGKVMLSYKIKPLLVVNNQVFLAVCTVSRSTGKTSGNLYAYYDGKEGVCCKYSFVDHFWKHEPMIKLNPEEWKILKVAKQDVTGDEIADIIGISHQNLRNTQASIYRKLKVNTRKQAEIFTNNHRIFIDPDQKCNLKKSEKEESKKQRHAMTTEKLQRIQEAMNKGESNRSVAKREGNRIYDSIRPKNRKIKKNQP